MKDLDTEKKCGFEDLLVAVLFDEATQEEREKFSAHTLQCTACDAEWQTLGTTRQAVSNWRDAELAHLSTRTSAPIVDLEEVFKSATTSDAPEFTEFAAPSAERSWSEKLTAFFGFSKGFALSTAAFAALLIGCLAVWSFFNPRSADLPPNNEIVRDVAPKPIEQNALNNDNKEVVENIEPTESIASPRQIIEPPLTKPNTVTPQKIQVSSVKPASRAPSRVALKTKNKAIRKSEIRASSADAEQIAADFVRYNRNVNENVSLAEVFGDDEEINR